MLMKSNPNKRNLTNFEKKVLTVVSRVPKSKVTTYKFLARAIGRPRAVRAVANALRKNPNLIKVPCHRVVRSNGEVGGYRLGPKKKLLLLKKEGIRFNTKNRIKNLKKFLYQF